MTIRRLAVGLLTVAVALLGVTRALPGGVAADDLVDPTRLPIGDDRVSHEPARGAVWACQLAFSGLGTTNPGPWLRDDGTFDRTAKAVVEGEVSWPSDFTITLTDGGRLLTGNGYPAHTTGVYPVRVGSEAFRYDRNPNAILRQSYRLTLPARPEPAAQPSCLPMGGIGVMLSGALIFNALDGPGRDAVAHEVQDHCGGHPERGGVYHYHDLTNCLIDTPGDHSPLLGYALDGFGLFGRYGEDGALLTNADLDDCHGHTHLIEWDGEGVALYHYHATWEYPYTLGCFVGTPQRSPAPPLSPIRPNQRG